MNGEQIAKTIIGVTIMICVTVLRLNNAVNDVVLASVISAIPSYVVGSYIGSKVGKAND